MVESNKIMTLDEYKTHINTLELEDLYKEVEALGGEVEGTPDKETCIAYLEVKYEEKLNELETDDDKETPVNEYEGKTFKELQQIAKEKGINTKGMNTQAILEALNTPVETDDDKIIPLDSTNKPVSAEVLKENPVIPAKFANRNNKKRKVEYGRYEGRKFKYLKNGMGLWADNGTVFVVADLDKEKIEEAL